MRRRPPLAAAVAVLGAGAVLLAAGLAAAQPPAAAPPGQARPTPKRSVQDSGDRRGPVTVDADRMERFGKENVVVFTGHVVARQAGSTQYADRTEVYLDEKGNEVARIVSTGNVRVVTKDCKTGTARRAEYTDLDQRLVLSGNARVWEDENVVTGETITIYLDEDRSVVEGGRQERVRAVIHPRERDGGAPRPARTCPE